MSRESDNASPRQRGTGGAAYPSGTPPYGTPGANGAGGAGAPRAAGPGAERAEPAETPKTETTLTTRIRINIPGSRPIPPVVVRSPLPSEARDEASGGTSPEQSEGPGGGSGSARGDDPEATPRVLGVVDDGTGTMAMPDLPPEWHSPETRAATTSGPSAPEAADSGGWFRPRKRSAGEPEGTPGGSPFDGPDSPGPGGSPFGGPGARANGAAPSGPAFPGGGPAAPASPFSGGRHGGAPEPGSPFGDAFDGRQQSRNGFPGGAPAAPASPFGDTPGSGDGPFGPGGGSRPGSGGPASPFGAEPGPGGDARRGGAFPANPASPFGDTNDPFAPPGDTRDRQPGSGFPGGPASPFGDTSGPGNDPFAPPGDTRDRQPGSGFPNNPASPFGDANGPGSDPFAPPAGPRPGGGFPDRERQPGGGFPGSGPASAFSGPFGGPGAGGPGAGGDPFRGGDSSGTTAQFPAPPGPASPFPPAAGGEQPERDPFGDPRPPRSAPPGRGAPTGGIPQAAAAGTAAPAPASRIGEALDADGASSPGATRAPVGKSGPTIPVGGSFGDGFAGGTGGAGAPPRTERPEGSAASPASAESAAESAAEPAAAASAGPAKKRARGRGRKLAVYAVTGVLAIGGVAYGAGLMLNQSDIPKGTTVLGTNIGGDSRDAAVAALDATVGKSSQQPLVLSIAGKTVQLSPSMAGLTIDTTATVQALAKHSYNPATVIGSLLSSHHAVVPTVVVDQQKLHAALVQLAASTASSSSHEGKVSFKVDAAGTGSVVTELPQAGQGLDVDAAAVVVQQAYQQRAEGSAVGTLTLPVGTVQPQVSAATVQQAADTIGKWAVSGRFYVKSADGTSVPFGPKTFSKALTLTPDANGKMVPTFDTTQLSAILAGTIDTMRTKAGAKATVQDVVAALTTLLENPGKTRTASI